MANFIKLEFRLPLDMTIQVYQYRTLTEYLAQLISHLLDTKIDSVDVLINTFKTD